MKYLIQFLKVIALILVGGILGILGTDQLVKRTTSDQVYQSTQTIPYHKVGLLLGTGKILANGHINLYYQYRIEAAVQLFNAGKIDFILVSGDNSTEAYDEPTTMKEDLIKSGVPAHRIFLDYAGFRTLDSVVRCKAIFGQSDITIISQQFHNERAIYLANSKNIEAIGFNAKDVSTRYGFKTQLREKLARVKMLLDLVFGKSPKFLGKKINIASPE